MVSVLLALAALAPPFYVDPPHTNAYRQAAAYEKAHRPHDARIMRRLAQIPQARWFTGGSPKQVRKDVKRLVDDAAPPLPVLVAYNVPNRDCSQYSAGGARTARGYRRWIDGFARGIGTRSALVILEPDALAGLCGDKRLANLRAAVKRLKRLPNATTYVDAGHSNWQPAARMAKRLERVGATHYALNVSNFQRTRDLVAYGHRLSRTMHFVIDTSRNGRGPWHGPEEWCNPPNRGLGQRPTMNTHDPLVDAFLWVKPPGESDGECADGQDPPAGQWWPEYALGLARRANPALAR